MSVCHLLGHTPLQHVTSAGFVLRWNSGEVSVSLLICLSAILTFLITYFLLMLRKRQVGNKVTHYTSSSPFLLSFPCLLFPPFCLFISYVCCCFRFLLCVSITYGFLILLVVYFGYPLGKKIIKKIIRAFQIHNESEK